MDAGKDVGEDVLSTADLGIGAAIESARYFDPAHPKRNAALLQIISQAGQSRRSNREILKLYDPAAYRLFYTPQGAADEELIGKALALDAWPEELPEAMIHAAPLPTIQWMRDQAKSDHPRVAELTLMWRNWGFWARVGHERQYTGELAEAAGRLQTNRAILADETTLAALVRFTGEIHGHERRAVRRGKPRPRHGAGAD